MTVKEKNTTWFFYGRFALNLLVIKVPKPISDLAYYQVLDNFFFSFFPWKQPWKYFFFCSNSCLSEQKVNLFLSLGILALQSSQLKSVAHMWEFSAI